MNMNMKKKSGFLWVELAADLIEGVGVGEAVGVKVTVVGS